MSESSSNPDELYKFRPLQALLDWKELEDGYIYFSHTKDLNDPMEGHVNLTFNADQIVWTNFFKNYIYSVYSFWMRLVLSGENWKKIMVAEDIYVSFDPEFKKSIYKVDLLYSGICKKFFDDGVINELIEHLSSRKAELTKIELMPLLFYVNIVILSKLDKVAEELKVSFVNPACRAVLYNFYGEVMAQEQIKAICEKYKNNDDSQSYYELFIKESIEIEDKIIIFASTLYELPYGKNIALLLGFPKVYLDKINKLIAPEYYIASFTVTYENPLMWVHYGDSGKGVCLIFSSDVYKEYENRFIPENKKGYTGLVHSFKMSKVNYINEIKEFPRIEFFSSLAPNQGMNLDHWFSNDGEISDIYENHWHYGFEDQKKISYLNTMFSAVLSKYKDFEYECEYRAVYLTYFPGVRNLTKDRKLKYDFKKLSGIIFGIRTPEKDKYEIIRIIKEKCIKYNRKNFDFYQAKINNEGKVEKYPIDIKLI